MNDRGDLAQILIVDDDASVRKSVSLLVKTLGYRVQTAESGERALELLETESYDTIFLDICMPGMDGITTLKRITEYSELVPVVMVTADDDVGTAVNCMRQGAFDYVVKPARRAILQESLKRAVRHRTLLVENRRLAQENARHRDFLEEQVRARTAELTKAYDLLKQNNLKTVRVLAEAIEAKDSYTRGHCNRVHILSRTMAHHLNLNDEMVRSIEFGSLLHDIGKIGVHEMILNKPVILSPEEFDLLRKHPLVGEQILRPLEFFATCLPIVRHHHEWFDGTGYPDGLAGDAIPFIARIVAVTDAFDAMTSTRAYRSAIGVDEALKRIVDGMGSQFDPELARLFVDQRIYKATEDIDIDTSPLQK